MINKLFSPTLCFKRLENYPQSLNESSSKQHKKTSVNNGKLNYISSPPLKIITYICHYYAVSWYIFDTWS